MPIAAPLQGLVLQVLEALPDAVYVVSTRDLALIHANQAGCVLLGYSLEHLKGLSLDLVSAEDADFTLQVARAYQEPILRGENVPSIEWNMRRRDGGTFWCDLSFKRADLDGCSCIVVVARDVTARRAETLNRLYAVLSEVGRTVVQCDDSARLFTHVSDILTMVGGFNVAAFGLVEGDGVQPAAAAGLGAFENGAAGVLQLACMAGGPAAVALETQRPVICNEFGDQWPDAWRRPVVDPAIGSCATIPMKSRSGILFVSSCERDFFGSSQMEALEQVVEEVDLALAHLDATEQRRRLTHDVQVLNHRHETILESAPHGIVTVDDRGDVTMINPAASRLLAYEPDELNGRNFHESVRWALLDGAVCPRGDGPLARVLAGECPPSPCGALFRRKEGEVFPVECGAAPLLDGGRVEGAVLSFVDVTHHHEVARMKGEFVSIVSHELRTPLTSIRGSLGILAGGVLGELPPRGQRMLEIALSNTDRLVRLINDILDLERMESGNMTLERRSCRGDELMSQAAEAVRSMAQNAGVTVRVSAPPVSLLADPDRVMQVLTNLLGNAIKFSPAGGAIDLSLRINGGFGLFEVSDQGRGIPSGMLDMVFERFAQVDASDARQKGGTGLGLPICRGIVEHHGGRIWADSVPVGGSVFRFTLPLAEGQPE